ncbi:hypothetical protein [Dyella sp. EPa41]|uniref:hypothetical protein n=1 Tax=Dyella sp. EPa41 TaxID=1561194 RepID=UPI001916983E|nr:hypothetical protein [Dyella sp. EPa41]
MTPTNRSIHDVDDDLLAACLCIGALADHVSEHGTGNAQVLANIERATDGFRRIMIERRAVVVP